MENYDDIITALTELKNWIKNYDGFCYQIEDIIEQLESPPFDGFSKE